MNKKILNTIEKHNMLSSKKVLIALSGGADSMVLLYFFHSLKNDLGIKLRAIHLNHNIRGLEAVRDQNFVEEQCKKLDVPLTIYSKNIPEIANETGESIEECGRRIRYELFFSEDSESMIATGHHLDDSAESTIFNLIRGTGISGLRGIMPVQGRVIRPLINCSKDEILEYCNEHEIPYMTDSTNQNRAYTRNKIREELIPVFKEINPDFLAAFSRNAEILSLYESFIKESRDTLLKNTKTDRGFSRKGLLAAHPALRKAALAKIAGDISGKTCEYKHIQAIEEILKEGGKVTLPKNKQLWAKSDELFEPLERELAQSKLDFYEVVINDFRKTYNIYGKKLKFSKFNLNIPNKSQKINNKVFNKLIDYDTIFGNLVIRGRKSGDKIRLFPRNCTKTVKKLFNEAKIPPHRRDSLLILSDDKGIVWLESFGVCERCAVNDKTRQALEVEIIAKGRHENYDG